jgi:hypothetical protein
MPLAASAVFAGPMLRRCEPKQVTVWVATTTDVQLDATVRPVGTAEWTGHTATFHRIKVFAGLWVHLLRVVPDKGTFPTGKLLEYSLGVVDSSGDTEHASFAAIVAAEKLAYGAFTLPTFYLQASGAKLNALYGSCRKVHDEKGDEADALSYGDSLVANNVSELSTRPAVLCLGGDQIYADDIHSQVFEIVRALATTLEKAQPEQLPGGLSAPGKDQRQDFMEKSASFTSDYASNHLITFAEYVAMYGVAFNVRHWPGGALPKEVEGFRKGLPAVRRLLANTPTYMIFDDHDVTDDWNFSIDWIDTVKKSTIGSRVIANALAAFWLFQGWGNDPTTDNGFVPKFIDALDKRLTAPDELAMLMGVRGTLNAWEFFTPTVPPIYFLDTRTQRGYLDGFKRSRSGPPAYLKSPDAWMNTLKQLKAIIKAYGRSVPLVLVAPAPIFGYETIDSKQAKVSKVVGPYKYDLEGWAANQGHLYLFLLMCGDADVVVLSGDVHYAFTSTAAFSVFDGDYIRFAQAKFPGFSFPKTGSGTSPTYDFLYASRFLQLNSSALKNYASGVLAYVSTLRGAYGHIVDKDFDVIEGAWKSPDLFKAVPRPQVAPAFDLVKVAPADIKPNFVLQQRVNDAGNSTYIAKHNLGMVSILGRRVDNFFLVDGAATSKHSWDFATNGPWEPRS